MRGRVLRFLDGIGKWSLLDFDMLVMMAVAIVAALIVLLVLVMVLVILLAFLLLMVMREPVQTVGTLQEFGNMVRFFVS